MSVFFEKHAGGKGIRVKDINFSMNRLPVTETKAWKDLESHFEKIKGLHMKDMFESDSDRFQKFSVNYNEKILLDYSKNRYVQGDSLLGL